MAFALALVIGLVIQGPAHGAEAKEEAKKPVVTNRVPVTQFYGAGGARRFIVDTEGLLWDAIVRQCTALPASQGLPTNGAEAKPYAGSSGGMNSLDVAPAVGIAGGMVVQWAVGAVVKQGKARLKKFIDKHVSTYTNDVRFEDVLVNDGRWSIAAQPVSCVAVQRYHCTENESHGCTSVDHKSTAIVALRREGDVLRVQPVGYKFDEFRPSHQGGTLAFSMGLSLQAIGYRDNAGYRWDSRENGNELLLFKGKCKASETDTEHPARQQEEKGCVWVNDRLDWSTAASLPLPPRLPGQPGSHAAFVFNTTEVGHVPGDAKLIASFLDGYGDKVSTAVSAALIEQWGLTAP